MAVTLSCLTWWAFVFEIDKSITLQGSVRPLKASSGIQTINGGRIASFNLVTGQMIDKGEVLATFDFSEQFQRAAELKKQISSLNIAKERLIAGLDGLPTFEMQVGYDAGHYAIQNKIFEAQRDAVRREKDALLIQIANLVEQQSVIKKQKQANEAAILLAQKKLSLVRQLFDKGFEGEIALLTAQQELEAARLTGSDLSSKVLQLNSEIALLRQNIIQIDTQSANQLANELFQISMQVEQLASEFNILDAQLTKQKLVSQVSGRITKVNVDDLGQVVEPGFVLAEYVPLNTEMAFELRINPQHINDINSGQSGQVVLSNMDVRSGEHIKGTVFEIDGDVTLLDSGERFYSGVAKISEQESERLIPGVDGSIAVNVGVRTVANYFLEPIIETMSSAMSEK